MVPLLARADGTASKKRWFQDFYQWIIFYFRFNSLCYNFPIFLFLVKVCLFFALFPFCFLSLSTSSSFPLTFSFPFRFQSLPSPSFIFYPFNLYLAPFPSSPLRFHFFFSLTFRFQALPFFPINSTQFISFHSPLTPPSFYPFFIPFIPFKFIPQIRCLTEHDHHLFFN